MGQNRWCSYASIESDNQRDVVSRPMEAIEMNTLWLTDYDAWELLCRLDYGWRGDKMTHSSFFEYVVNSNLNVKDRLPVIQLYDLLDENKWVIGY